MILRNIIYLFTGMIFSVVKISENTSVKINVYPNIIKDGDSVIVECLIYNISTFDPLKTFLHCPFQEQNMEYCYADCASICQFISCNEKAKFINTFKCSRYIGNNPKRFIYNIPSISKEQINNRKLLPFSCKYMGLNIWENISVVNDLFPNGDGTKIITDYPPVNANNNSILNFSFRDILIITLIFILLISFFINIWCCVQWCIRSKKHRKRKRVQYLEIKADTNSQNNDQNTLEMLDYSNENGENISKLSFDPYAHIRRARSNPVLLNNGKNTLVKLSTNLIKRPGSTNDNLKHWMPTYNNSNNEIYQNGANNEQVYPFQGQQVLGIMNPQFMPAQYLTPQSFIIVPQQCYNMNISLSEDLNEYKEDDSPESMQSSTIQQLIQKPYDCSSNLESSSSLIV